MNHLIRQMMMFSASLRFKVGSITLTASGQYGGTPTVVFTGGGGSGAAATANMIVSGGGQITGGSVDTVSITTAGLYYFGSAAPSVSFSGGGGSGAAATASLKSTSDYSALSSITVTDGGLYNTSNAPFVQIDKAGAMINPTATAVMINNGNGTWSVSAINVTNQGIWTSSSSSALTINIQNNFGNEITKATASLTKEFYFGINSVTVTNGGSGYTSTASVSFSGGTFRSLSGYNAAATASMSYTYAPIVYSVNTISVTNAGSGYTSAPSISFSGGSPSVAATATANMISE